MKKKKIALDLRWIRGGKLDGIGRYTAGLIPELVREGTRRHPLRFVILYDDERQEGFIPPPASPDGSASGGRGQGVEKLKLSFPVLSPKEPFLLPRILKAEGISLFWSPYFLTYPFFKDLKTVLTVHDLIPLQRGAYGSLARRVFFSSRTPTSYLLKKADLLICDSWATKSDLANLFGLEGIIVHGGIAKRFWGAVSRKEKGKVRKRYHLPPKFILCLSRLEPYKNLTTLLDAYHLLPRKVRKTYPLVIAGKKDKRYLSLLERAKNLNLENSVSFPGYIEDRDLPALYQLSSLFVYPSLAEGFGFPPLEAMASGIPVVCFRIPPLVEVVGDGGVLVPSFTQEALSSAMEKLLADKGLATALSQKGKEAARRFTWDRAARQLIRLFDGLLSGRRSEV